jgi:hypothetical protein
MLHFFLAYPPPFCAENVTHCAVVFSFQCTVSDVYCTYSIFSSSIFASTYAIFAFYVLLYTELFCSSDLQLFLLLDI